MDKHPTITGLSPGKLAQLWNIGSETDKTEPSVDQDNRKTELLQDLLAGTLPTGLIKAKLRRKEHENLRSAVNFLVDKTIDKILRDPGANIMLLRKVKDHGKRLSDNAGDKAEYHVANTIYYAAIASALVFHNRRITKFSYNDLEKYFCRLDKEKWIPETLRSLFSRAAEYCQMG